MEGPPKSLHEVLEEMGHVENGRFRWPNDPARQCEVVRLMWGHHLVGDLDDSLYRAGDFVLNPQSSQPVAPAFQRQELQRRATFASMTPEQHEAVLDLVRDTAMSLLFSVLVSIDQPPFRGEMQIRVVRLPNDDDEPEDKEEDEPEMLQIAPPLEASDTMFDLHDELHFWVDDFSSHAEELVRRQRREDKARKALMYSEPGKDANGDPLSEDDAKQQKQMQGMIAVLKDSMRDLRENPDNPEIAEANFTERLEKMRREMLGED